jgi:hypothetical protein
MTDQINLTAFFSRKQINLTAFFSRKSASTPGNISISRVAVSSSTNDADKMRDPTKGKIIHPIQKYPRSFTESCALPRVDQKGELFLMPKDKRGRALKKERMVLSKIGLDSHLEKDFSNLSLSLTRANARTCSKALHQPFLDQ